MYLATPQGVLGPIDSYSLTTSYPVGDNPLGGWHQVETQGGPVVQADELWIIDLDNDWAFRLLDVEATQVGGTTVYRAQDIPLENPDDEHLYLALARSYRLKHPEPSYEDWDDLHELFDLWDLF